MKKLLSMLTIVLAAITSCSGNDDNESKNNAPNVQNLIIGKWAVAGKWTGTDNIYEYEKWYSTEGDLTLTFNPNGKLSVTGKSVYIIPVVNNMRVNIDSFDGCYEYKISDLKTKDGVTTFGLPLYFNNTYSNSKDFSWWDATLKSNNEIEIHLSGAYNIAYLLRKN